MWEVNESVEATDRNASQGKIGGSIFDKKKAFCIFTAWDNLKEKCSDFSLLWLFFWLFLLSVL